MFAVMPNQQNRQHPLFHITAALQNREQRKYDDQFLKELKQSRGIGIDISAKAIQTAEINSRNLNLNNRSKFKVCDLDKYNTKDLSPESRLKRHLLVRLK